MSAQLLFDQFAYTDRLARGGFTPDQARASAEALGTAFSEAVATKSDVAEIKAEIAAVEMRLEAKIAAVESGLETKISGLEARFISELHSTIYKGVAVLGGLIVIVSGAAAFVAKVPN
jgi:hypothetical protein